MLVPTSSTVCFIACSIGAADHFATYAQGLVKRNYDVQIYASEPALIKFESRGIKATSILLKNLTPKEADELAQTMAKVCATAYIVITDVGDIFTAKFHKAFKAYKVTNVDARDIPHAVYYDNYEDLVPGEYSLMAAAAIDRSEGAFFASAKLATAKIYSAPGVEIDFNDKKRIGMGYFPMSKSESIAEKRQSYQATARSTFLRERGIEDTGQKIIVYFGGNNKVYFSDALPAFLSFITQASKEIDLQNFIIIFQQHPSAKRENQDGLEISDWLEKLRGSPNIPKIILSDFSSDHAQILGDFAFYFQTSMGPQFVLAGIPVVQIGHEKYPDILVRNGAPSVSKVEEFVQLVGDLEAIHRISKKDMINILGYKEDWLDRLVNGIDEMRNKSKTRDGEELKEQEI